MGMTIDNIVREFNHIKYVGDGYSEYTQEKQEAMALNEAENILRKYQKIEQIYSDYLKYMNPDNLVDRLGEVVEDGNDNN